MINSVQAIIFRNTNRRQLPARIAAVFGGNTKSKNTIDVFRQPQPTTTMIKTISTVSTNNYYQQRYSDTSHAYKKYYSTSTSSLKEDSSKEGVDHSSNDNNTQQVQSQTPPLSSLSSSPFGNTTKNKSNRRKKKRIIPRKAAVELTEKARTIFQKLLDNQPTKDGILLNYKQSATGEPRMVFSFSFVSKEDLDDQDEGYVNYY